MDHHQKRLSLNLAQRDVLIVSRMMHPSRLSLNLAQRDVLIVSRMMHLIVSRMMHPSRPKNALMSGGRCPERRPHRTAVHVIMHRAFHHKLQLHWVLY